MTAKFCQGIENPVTFTSLFNKPHAHHLLPLTSYLLPLTSYLLPLTSYLLPLTSYYLPLTSYNLPLTTTHPTKHHRSPITQPPITSPTHSAYSTAIRLIRSSNFSDVSFSRIPSTIIGKPKGVGLSGVVKIIFCDPIRSRALRRRASSN